jgi:hypothetical protein
VAIHFDTVLADHHLLTIVSAVLGPVKIFMAQAHKAQLFSHHLITEYVITKFYHCFTSGQKKAPVYVSIKLCGGRQNTF